MVYFRKDICLDVCAQLHVVNCKQVYESQAKFDNMLYVLAGKRKKLHSDHISQNMDEVREICQRTDKHFTELLR